MVVKCQSKYSLCDEVVGCIVLVVIKRLYNLLASPYGGLILHKLQLQYNNNNKRRKKMKIETDETFINKIHNLSTSQLLQIEPHCV